MQLHFLGQSYSKPHNQLLPSSTNESKSHLPGRRNVALRPIKSFKADWGLRKYRGINYVELRFLGQY